MGREIFVFTLAANATAFIAAVASQFDTEEAFVESSTTLTVTVRYRLQHTLTELAACACSIENITASGGSALLEDYFIDTDTGNDTNSGADFSNAWLTLEPLKTIPFGRIHFRGSQDTPSIVISNGEFIFIRDGTMAGRLGKINIHNTKLRLGEAFFDPNEALNLTALNADFNCDVVVNTNHTWTPQSDNVFRISNNSRLQINDDQTIVGTANRLIFCNLNSLSFMLQGNDFLDGGSAQCTTIGFCNNSSFLVLGNQQLASAFTVTGAPVNATNVATVRCVPYGGVFETDYPGSTIDASSIVEGWVDYPYRAMIEEILAEVTTTGTAVFGSLLPVDVSGGIATVTPPADARETNKFGVVDSRGNAATNNITVDFVTAGYNFYGASANDVIATDEAMYRYTFINSTVGFVRET
jgi:hypothetical protein